VTDVWNRLAAILDKMPNAYPKTDGDEHIRLLQWIFTEEEAELACELKLRGETLVEISERVDYDSEVLLNLLETMHQKGQIRAWTSSRTGVRRYGLMPFAVGIYEEQLGRMDSDFAHRFEEFYLKDGFRTVLSTEPAPFKVIAVNEVVDSELEIYPNEVAQDIVENSSSWGIRECICKKQKALIGEPCSYPTTVCLILAPNTENAFDDDELTKTITKEEAHKILRDAETAGLVHCTSNVKDGINYICNCCTCCCGILRGIAEFDYPHAVVKSDYIAHVDVDLCSGCESCIERCQFNALSVPDDVCVVDTKRCVGCGVCAIVCPEAALKLIDRPVAEHKEKPENLMDWMTQKAISRGVDPSDLL